MEDKAYALFDSILYEVVKFKRCAIAVSGGRDSVMLLHMVDNWLKVNCLKLEIVVITVDHGLRDQSKYETLFVRDMVLEMGYKCIILKCLLNGVDSNIQAQARDARYKLMTKWCRDSGFNVLLTAHNLNDQAETVFMRISRGSGIDGVCGIAYKKIMNKINIFRPILGYSRKRITKYLSERAVGWIEDPSNFSTRYSRTLFRKYIQTSEIDEELLCNRIKIFALHMSNVKNALDYYVRREVKNVVNIYNAGYLDIEIKKLCELPDEISSRVLMFSLKVIGCRLYKPRYSSFVNIFNNIKNFIKFSAKTINGCKLYYVGDSYIRVIRELNNIGSDVLLEDGVLWDNRFECKLQGCVIPNNKNLFVSALGITGYYSLKDIVDFKTSSVPKDVLYTIPVIKSNNEVVYSPDIKYNVSEGVFSNNFNEVSFVLVSSLLEYDYVSYV